MMKYRGRAWDNHQENKILELTLLLVCYINFYKLLDFSGPQFPQLWIEVSRLDFLYGSCHLGENVINTVNINHAPRTLPLYLLSFLLVMNQLFLSLHKQLNSCSIVFKILRYWEKDQEKRFESPLNGSKNKINIQTFLFNIIKLKFSDWHYHCYICMIWNSLEKENI